MFFGEILGKRNREIVSILVMICCFTFAVRILSSPPREIKANGQKTVCLYSCHKSGKELLAPIMLIVGSITRRRRQSPRKLRLPSPYQGAESSPLRQKKPYSIFRVRFLFIQTEAFGISPHQRCVYHHGFAVYNFYRFRFDDMQYSILMIYTISS